jgi:hypothetical protein
MAGEHSTALDEHQPWALRVTCIPLGITYCEFVNFLKAPILNPMNREGSLFIKPEKSSGVVVQNVTLLPGR